MADDAQHQKALRVLPDEVRRLGAATARCEDRLEVLEAQRTTFVPSKSFSNMSGRQREVVFFICLCLLGEVIHRLVRKVDHAPLAA